MYMSVAVGELQVLFDVTEVENLQSWSKLWHTRILYLSIQTYDYRHNKFTQSSSYVINHSNAILIDVHSTI